MRYICIIYTRFIYICVLYIYIKPDNIKTIKKVKKKKQENQGRELTIQSPASYSIHCKQLFESRKDKDDSAKTKMLLFPIKVRPVWTRSQVLLM